MFWCQGDNLEENEGFIHCWLLSWEIQVQSQYFLNIHLWVHAPFLLVLVLVCVCVCVYIYKLANHSQRLPFSIATTSKCRGECYSFLWIALLTLDPYLMMLSVKQGGIEYHFCVFGMTHSQIEHQSLGPLVNTLTIMPMSWCLYIKRALESLIPNKKGIIF